MTRINSALALVALAATAGCGGADGDAEVRTPPAERAQARASLPERTAAQPATQCGWIPASEVEAVVGKLSGPSRPFDGGCLYPLPLDSATIARRAKSREIDRARARAGMKSDLPSMPEDSAGVVVQVTVGTGADERAAELGFATAGSWIGDETALAARTAPAGWDYARRFPGLPNFFGRAGTVLVSVKARTPGAPLDRLAALAARVRDRVPDLPFVHPNATTAPPPGPDPCSLLSRADAEAVLGKLLVAPYRARDGGALADAGGGSCAYYTGGHRALVVTPHFADGKNELRFIRFRGGLAAVGVGDKDAEAADTLEGPWDEVAIGVQGQLAALTGDRLLEIAHLTSSTDAAGAIRLARAALPRLAAARP